MNKNELRESVDGKRSEYNDFMAHVNSSENQGGGCGKSLLLLILFFVCLLLL